MGKAISTCTHCGAQYNGKSAPSRNKHLRICQGENYKMRPGPVPGKLSTKERQRLYSAERRANIKKEKATQKTAPETPKKTQAPKKKKPAVRPKRVKNPR